MWLLRELGQLVIPVACPGCGLPDVAACPYCLLWLAGPLHRVDHLAPRLADHGGRSLLPVWALGGYTGSARGLVVAWKNQGRADLAPVLATALALELPTLSAVIGGVSLVAAMPSSSASVRRRGREHLRPLAKAVAAALAAEAPRMLAKRTARHQVGLTARARGGTLVRVRRRFACPPPLAGRRCLLIDDVLTTGATLASAHTELTRAGWDVVGAVVLAATPPRGTLGRSADGDDDGNQAGGGGNDDWER